jgi:hypothetical protein
MNRARVAFGATLVATMLTAGTALAQATTTQAPATQAPPLPSVLAGKKFTPPIKGEALIEYTSPVTKREKDLVVTRITVRNASLAPVPRLVIAETWYDKSGAIVTGGRGEVKGLLQPGEIQTIVIETPYKTGMSSNNYNFSHANGSVKPTRVQKLDVPKDGADAKAASSSGANPAPTAKPAPKK